MRLLRSAAVLAATLSALLVAPVGTGSPASAETPRRGVDTTPAAVGTCHALTFKEGFHAADPDPAVDCATAHTTVTVKVVALPDSVDWGDAAALSAALDGPCEKAKLKLFDGNARSVQMSAYDIWWFEPTKAQKAAGARWIRCDVALTAGETLRPLPTDGDPQLGQLPLDDRVARCRRGKAANYYPTACDKKHAYRAAVALKHPGAAYPGLHRMVAWTHRRCTAKLGRSFGYYQTPTRVHWKVGERYTICFKKTTS
jgi:hypothetical protein